MLQKIKVTETKSIPIKNSSETFQYGLTKCQWQILKAKIIGADIHFCGKTHPTANLLFQFIWHRTLNWNKLTESFTFRDIRNGHERWGHLGTGLNDASINRAKKYLLDKGIIQVSKSRPKKLWYRFNLVGMLQFLIQVSYPGRFHKKSQYRDLLIILEKIKSHFKNSNNEINFNYKGKVVKLKDISEIVNKQTKLSEEKRIEKQNRKKLNASMLPNYFRKSCEDVGVSFSPAVWNDRDWGSAKNFLNECYEHNKNPRLIIQQVCDRWWHFRTRLTSENGKGVMLDEVINFRQFFNFRGEIQSWLQENVPVDNVHDIHSAKSKQSSNQNYAINYPDGTSCSITTEEFDNIKNDRLSWEDIYERRRQSGELPGGCMEGS